MVIYMGMNNKSKFKNKIQDKILVKRCDKCGADFEILRNTFWQRNSRNQPMYCQSCMKEYRFRYVDDAFRKSQSEKTKQQMANMSDEQKQERAKKISKTSKQMWERWNNTPSKKKHISDMARKRYYSMSDEKKSKMREAHKKWWDKQSDETKAQLNKNYVKWWNGLSDEEKKTIIEKSKRWRILEPERFNEIKEKHSKFMKTRWEKMSDEEKKSTTAGLKAFYEKMTPEERLEYRRLIQSEVQASISDEERAMRTLERIRRLNEWRTSLPKEQLESMMRKILNGNNKRNTLTEKFERYFKDSIISKSYHYTKEYFCSANDVSHSWDYAIFNENDQLQMVIDLDGAFYHGDLTDYDGAHSREEYDEKRLLSVPSGIKYHIIYEKKFTKSFELMIQKLMLDYDDFIEDQFNQCRSLLDIPYPHYTPVELVRSYEHLRKMKTDDKYHKTLSMNNREGDRIINHFHHSIYLAKRKTSKLSPREAWNDDDLLRKIIRNRIIYINKINPNKILQGFNISNVAQKVSVFSAARAKMIIAKYLSEFDEIFDPFSGFSGRMIGAVSLDKKYIGQDISKIHIEESKKIISFLIKYGYSPEVYLSKKDINSSYGEYPCLFTCPPYSDKEQWFDVPVSKNTCDDWIDICLAHFKCKRYVFIVDHTDKYQSNIVIPIINKSHMNMNEEYLVIIDK